LSTSQKGSKLLLTRIAKFRIAYTYTEMQNHPLESN
jgi:hypothetical protein